MANTWPVSISLFPLGQMRPLASQLKPFDVAQVRNELTPED